VDKLFDDLDRSKREALDKDDVCLFMLDKLKIKVYMNIYIYVHMCIYV
jgi:hypothetical protein